MVFTIDSNNAGIASIQNRHASVNANAYGIASNPLGGNVGIGVTTIAAALHTKQLASAGAIPVLKLEQEDVDQDMIELTCTAGAGNAIEAVGDKALTTTAFIKVTVNGDVRYIPCGTIA